MVTWKNPSPRMATSRLRPVLLKSPTVKTRVVEETRTPVPTSMPVGA